MALLPRVRVPPLSRPSLPKLVALPRLTVALSKLWVPEKPILLLVLAVVVPR